uniref:Uncharacterized protein n=1 Tax=viral metagenome TaxID=1070528 RepID=A0A6M3IJI2_9ZZZZ
MAFTATEIARVKVMPGYVEVIGYYVNTASSTGGNITHGLNEVVNVQLTSAGSAADNAHVYNETLPLSSGTAVTIVTGADESGSYRIFGRP